MDAYFCVMLQHESYMQRCLQLAALGAGHVAPNPMVGAVLVYANRIIGEGYHQKYGDAHAEVNCINNVSDADKACIRQSTMYVSLEPCAHFGKTPPCADLIVKNEIPKVVIGCMDSFVAVAGKGIDKLKQAGIDVLTGILEKECLDLNRRFFTCQNLQRPYIILKWAQSSNNKIGLLGTDRMRISNDFTNRLVHKWRSEEASILVGTNTAMQDDPALTARHWPGKNPVRLVIDNTLKLPSHINLFDGHTKTVVFNTIKAEEKGNLVYLQIDQDKKLLEQISEALYAMHLQSVIVEGGSKLLQSFIDEGIWDEARVICNGHLVIADGVSAPVLKNHLLVKEQKIKTDTISFYKNKETTK